MAGVIGGPSLWIAQGLIRLGETHKQLGVPGIGIVGMIALGQKPVDAMKRLRVGVRTQLHDFVVVLLLKLRRHGFLILMILVILIMTLLVFLLGLFALGRTVEEFDAGPESALGILVAPADSRASGDLDALVAELAPNMNDRPGFNRSYQGDAESGLRPVHQVRRHDARIAHPVPQFDADNGGRGSSFPLSPAALISLGSAHGSLVLSTFHRRYPGFPVEG